MPMPERVHQHRCVPRIGGAASVCLTLCQGLSELGIKCELSHELSDPLAASAWPDALHAPGQPWPDNLPGLVHLHSSRDWPLLLASLGRFAGNVVITAHDCSLITGGCVYPMRCELWEDGCRGVCPRDYPLPAQRRELLKDLLLKQRPLIVSPSGWLAGLLRRNLEGLSVKVVPNGIVWPGELLPREQARQRLGIALNAKVILFLAHGGEKAGYKGAGYFRRIFERIKAVYPQTVGIIAGGEEQARQGDLILLPYVSGEMLSAVLRASDILLYPSLADNHPLILLEAASQELPVLAHAQGGIPEQISDKETGFLLTPVMPDEFAEQAIKLLAEPRGLRKVAEDARRLGQPKFNHMRMAKDYLRIYKSLASGRN